MNALERALVALRDQLCEADDAHDELSASVFEIETALAELESFRQTLRDAISSLEEAEGVSVSVSVELDVNVDLSL